MLIKLTYLILDLKLFFINEFDIIKNIVYKIFYNKELLKMINILILKLIILQEIYFNIIR